MTETTNTDNPKPIREPFLAGILSFLWIGLGQAYNGQRKRGYLFFASQFLPVALYLVLLQAFGESLPKSGEEVPAGSRAYMISIFCYFLVWVWNIYDAQNLSKRINRGELTTTETAGRSAFVFLRSVVLAFLAMFVVFIVIIVVGTMTFGKNSMTAPSP